MLTRVLRLSVLVWRSIHVDPQRRFAWLLGHAAEWALGVLLLAWVTACGRLIFRLI